MPIRGKDAEPAVKIKYHPWVTRDNGRFPQGVEDAQDFLRRLRGRTKTEIAVVLERRSERKVFQKELRTPYGALRMIFYWGANGTLWYLGAFVKHNDAEGDRLIKPLLERRFDVDENDAEEAAAIKKMERIRKNG